MNKSLLSVTSTRDNKKLSQSWCRGFTLIELLVVIAIIGILSSVVLTSLNSARMKARDAKRISDLKQIQIALELYFNTNGSYPALKWATSEATSYDSGTKWNSLQIALAPYINSLPNDPKPTGTSGPWSTGHYHYAYGSYGGNVYDLVAQLENTSSNQRCAIKQWEYHSGEGGHPAGTTWCGGFSPYLYADH